MTSEILYMTRKKLIPTAAITTQLSCYRNLKSQTAKSAEFVVLELPHFAEPLLQIW